MEKDNKKVEEKVVYNYHGTELTDKSAILYYKQAHYLEKLENKLLGQFDKSGKYAISNDILKELVAIKKVIEKTDDDKIYANAKVEKNTLKFVIEIGDIDKDTKYATLKIVEQSATVLGEKKSSVLTPVVYYKDANNQYFNEKIYKLFNLLTKDESEGKDIKNDELAKLIIKNLNLANKKYDLFLKQTKNKDKMYVQNMLKILESSGPFGAHIERRYNALLKENASILNKKNDNYYHVLKQLLDKVMIEEEKNMPKDLAASINKIRNKYVQTIENSIENVITNPPTKVEDKEIKLKGGSGGVIKGSAFSPNYSKKAAAKFNSPIDLETRQTQQTKSLPNVTKDVQQTNEEPEKNWSDFIRSHQDFVRDMKHKEIQKEAHSIKETVHSQDHEITF